jgi:hypothetical protein
MATLNQLPLNVGLINGPAPENSMPPTELLFDGLTAEWEINISA